MTDSGSGTGVDKIMNRCKCFETGKSEINRRKCWITLNILNWRIKNKNILKKLFMSITTVSWDLSATISGDAFPFEPMI